MLFCLAPWLPYFDNPNTHPPLTSIAAHLQGPLHPRSTHRLAIGLKTLDTQWFGLRMAVLLQPGDAALVHCRLLALRMVVLPALQGCHLCNLSGSNRFARKRKGLHDRLSSNSRRLTLLSSLTSLPPYPPMQEPIPSMPALVTSLDPITRPWLVPALIMVSPG